jgi:hypothetical protein
MLYPVWFLSFFLFYLLLKASTSLAFSIILEISCLILFKSKQKLSHVLDFCVDYYFKSPIPQDVGIQLRHVTNNKKLSNLKPKIFQKKSCMLFTFIIHFFGNV